ncbi:hypothetical protein GCM10027168_05750 [Streptomyces capparidis]
MASAGKRGTAPRGPVVKATVPPPECPACKGEGQVARTVRVGRKRRPVGEQEGICLTCFGSGEASE